MAGFSNNRGGLTKLASSLEDHLYVLSNAAGPLGVAVFLMWVSDWWIATTFAVPTDVKTAFELLWALIWNPLSGVIICIAITIYGAIGQAKDTKNLRTELEEKKSKLKTFELDIDKMVLNSRTLESNLRGEVESNYQLAEELVLAYKKVAHLWTCQIFTELTLDVKHRISIYYLDGDKKNLVLLERFAKNHEYNMAGRPFFPRDQGVIGHAWSNGSHFEKRIPIFNRKNTHYYQYLEDNYELSRDVSSRLRMKSRTIGGFAIEDAQGHHIGVIIFESLDQNDFDDEKLQDIVKRENARLVEFISDTSTRDIRKLPSDDVEKGGAREQKAA